MSRSACCVRSIPGRASATTISARHWRAPINDWQIAEWTGKDCRLKGSVVVANEDGPAAAAEIRKRAGDKNFVQVLLLSRNVEPLGQRRYWPIYEAAEEAGLPVGVHAFGFGGNPITASGWPSFYIEEMVGHSQCQQTALASIVLEGVFERHPKLKMIMIEAGFGWAPSLSWRLDKNWQRLRSEVPHVKRPPSEYHPRAHLVDHAADGRSRNGAIICSR